MITSQRRVRPRATFTIVLALALTWACGSLPSGVRRAQQLLTRGDYAGAERAADAELGRYPDHATLWRVKVQAAMGKHDNARAVASYAKWRQRRGKDDPRLLEQMARMTLWQALRAPSAVLNTRAIQIIERLEIESLAQDVADKIADDNDVVAAAAAVALLRSHPQAAHVLTELLGSDDASARAIAVEGIGRKIKKPARADLLPMLGDSDARVRRTAINAIAAMKVKDDSARLVEIARGDSDGTVRAQALRGLAHTSPSDLLAIARAASADPYLGARLAAVALLVEVGSDARPLLAELSAGDDQFVALRAAIAVAKLGAPAPRTVLARALDADSWNVRVAAINAIGELTDDREGRALLEPRLRDDRIEVRLAAARALSRYDRPRAITELAAALDHADGRLQAAMELAHLDDERGIQAIAELTASTDVTTRGAAIGAHLIAGILTPALVAALADDASELRVAAAGTLLDILD